MEFPYQVPIYTQNLFISSTHQHDHLLAWFIQGIHFLESQLARNTYSASDLSTITQSLLDIARSITHYLDRLTSLQTPEIDTKLRKAQAVKATWLRDTVDNVAIHWHRYSIIVSEIARRSHERAAVEPFDKNMADVTIREASYRSFSSRNMLEAFEGLEIQIQRGRMASHEIEERMRTMLIGSHPRSP